MDSTKLEKQTPFISTIVNHHFCIENSSAEQILNIMETIFTEKVPFDKEFEMDFIFSYKIDDSIKRFLLFDRINEWSYLCWNVRNFQENRNFASYLSEKLKTKVYYFFDDPWVATVSWVLTDNGKIIKSYDESHGSILFEEGNFELEENIRKDYIEDGGVVFNEMKFFRLYQTICQPIEIINKSKNIEVIKGELK